MRAIYLLIVLVIAASGCIGNKQADKQIEPSTNAPIPQTQASASPTGTQAPVTTPVGGTENDLFGTENELASVDSLASDMNMDIAFSDSI